MEIAAIAAAPQASDAIANDGTTTVRSVIVAMAIAAIATAPPASDSIANDKTTTVR